MSTQSAANGSNLRRTTNWNVADPITTISLWWFFNSLAALRTIWDAGDNTSFRPQLYYDNGSNKVFLANAILEPSFEVIDAPSINTAYYAAVVLNLGEVGYIDSGGLGQLVASYGSLSKTNGGLKLLHVNRRNHDLLSITRLVTIFDTFDSEDEAVKSFS